MAYDITAPLPVYLPKRMTQDETQEDYDASIAANEDGINQNFTEHNNAILDLMDRVAALEGAQ